MNRVSLDEFGKRFVLLREAQTPTEVFKKGYYRDALHRRNVVILSYSLNSAEECTEVLHHAERYCHPELSVPLLGHCYVLPSGFTGIHELLLIFDHCQTMEDFFYGEEENIDHQISLKSVEYIFYRVSQMLEYLKEIDSFHGNIDEEHLFVDQEGKLRMMKVPFQKTNIESLMVETEVSKHVASPALLSPELMTYMIDNRFEGADQHLDSENLIKSDLFSLGLLIVRLLSPRAFSEGYSLEKHLIEVERLYLLIDTLGVFVDSQLASVVRHCLTVDARFRPEPEYLVEEMTFEYDSIPRRLDKGTLKQRDHLVQLSSYRKDKGALTDPLTGSFTSPKKNTTRTFTGNYTPATSARKPLPMAYGGSVDIEPFRQVTVEKTLFSDEKESKIARAKIWFLKEIEENFFDRVMTRAAKECQTDRGRLVSKTLRDGAIVGFIFYDNKDIYFGYVKNGKCHDVGLMFFSNGEVYEGEFEDGKIGGQGRLLLKNGLAMNGHWLNNLMHGNFTVDDYDKKIRVLCTFKNHKLLAKTGIEDMGSESSQMDDPLMMFYKEGAKCTDLLKELIHDHINQSGSINAPNPTSVGKARQRMRRKFNAKVENSSDQASELVARDVKNTATINQPDSEIAQKIEEKKRRQEKFTNYDGEGNDYRKPAYVNSNRKEREFEKLPGRGLTSSSHKTALELLENSNRAFTYPKYYDDLYSTEKPKQLELTAQLDPALSRTINQSNRHLSSPQRHYHSRSISKSISVDDHSMNDDCSDDSYRLNDAELTVKNDRCDEKRAEESRGKEGKLSAVEEKGNREKKRVSPVSKKNEEIRVSKGSSVKKGTPGSKQDDRNMIPAMRPKTDSLQLPSDRSSQASVSKDKRIKNKLTPKKPKTSSKKPVLKPSAPNPNSKDSETKGRLSKPELQSLDFADLSADGIKSRPAADFDGYAWIKFTDGSKFYGFFVAGLPTGNGTFTTAEGKKVAGRWKKGKYVH